MLTKKEDAKVCGSCKQIIEGECYTAMGEHWHPEHFVCYYCKQMIEGSKFYVKNDHPYCKQDFLELYGQKCNSCKEPIGEIAVTALDSHWHPEHFICKECKKIIDVKQFFAVGGEIYCKTCHENKHCPVCASCKKNIVDNFISALNMSWHVGCFKCYGCSHVVKNIDRFAVYKGSPVCNSCVKQKGNMK